LGGFDLKAWQIGAIIGLIYGYIGTIIVYGTLFFDGLRIIAVIFSPSLITKINLSFLSVLYGETVYNLAQLVLWASTGAIIGLATEKYKQRRTPK
jgi:hypothetical protein